MCFGLFRRSSSTSASCFAISIGECGIEFFCFFFRLVCKFIYSFGINICKFVDKSFLSFHSHLYHIIPSFCCCFFRI
nr:MAG TPA: hypothetical protein [Caudoviricetes sp.]